MGAIYKIFDLLFHYENTKSTKINRGTWQLLSLKQITFTKKLAGVAQLVERQLPKLKVAGSRPVSRSQKTPSHDGVF